MRQAPKAKCDPPAGEAQRLAEVVPGSPGEQALLGGVGHVVCSSNQLRRTQTFAASQGILPGAPFLLAALLVAGALALAAAAARSPTRS